MFMPRIAPAGKVFLRLNECKDSKPIVEKRGKKAMCVVAAACAASSWPAFAA